jgi:hypothetical protein
MGYYAASSGNPGGKTFAFVFSYRVIIYLQIIIKSSRFTSQNFVPIRINEEQWILVSVVEFQKDFKIYYATNANFSNWG